MDRHEKAKRAVQLSEEIKQRETELDQLLGGDAAPKQRKPGKCVVMGPWKVPIAIKDWNGRPTTSSN